MERLRQDCSRLTDRYLLAQAVVLLAFGMPVLACRFAHNGHALILSAVMLMALVANTLLARRAWQRLTTAWAHGEADHYLASVRGRPRQ
ncbi:MAG TPA: hypothetical protein VND63_08360 [Rhodanobacteraceae bacterium]|nr:hypothetical protein [Rhodanobacteraceae bacterium]